MDVFRTENGQPPAFDERDLSLEVKHALMGLYDPISLQNSPLAVILRKTHAEVAPGQEAKVLRQVLIEAIGDLRPGDKVPLRSAGHRSYAALRGRYIDQLEIPELADALGIGGRQLRRELRAGLEAVTAIVARRLQRRPSLGAPSVPPPTGHQPVLAEIEAMDSWQRPVNLCTEVRNVQALVIPLAKGRNTTVCDRVDLESVVVRADRVVLRQALLALYSWALARGRGHVLEARVLKTGSKNAAFELVTLGGEGQPHETSQEEAPIPAELLQALQARLEITPLSEGQAVRLILSCAPLLTLLLVDDNRGFHQLFKRYLSGLPVRVLSAYHAPGGLALARSEKPDVVVLDIMMPDQDGWELLANLQAEATTRDLPIVICSVLSQEALARSLAVAGYLRKPVTQAALLSTLRSLDLGDFG